MLGFIKKLKIIFMFENIISMYWCLVYFDLLLILLFCNRYRRKIKLRCLGVDVDFEVFIEL